MFPRLGVLGEFILHAGEAAQRILPVAQGDYVVGREVLRDLECRDRPLQAFPRVVVVGELGLTLAQVRQRQRPVVVHRVVEAVAPRTSS